MTVVSLAPGFLQQYTAHLSHLQISQLGKLLPTIVQEAGKWLRVLVSDLVGADVAALGESLLANITREWLFPGMASLVGLE